MVGSLWQWIMDSWSDMKQVRYRLNLNTMSVRQPEGAAGGTIIEAEHDLEMLERIWDS